MPTFSVKSAVVEYLVLKYVKAEGIIPKATIIRETSLYLPNKAQLTYRVLNGHIQGLIDRGKIIDLEAEEYEITSVGLELLIRRRVWIKRWITANENQLGLNNTVLLNTAIDEESKVEVEHLEYENIVASAYDEQVDDLSSAEPDDLVELYSQIKALNAEVLQLREDIKHLKQRANSSFKTVFKILKEHSHVETVVNAPNPIADLQDMSVDSYT